MTGVTLDTPHGVVFKWTEPDRVGVGDETDFPLEEKEKGGKRAKVVVEYEMGDEKNRLRRLMNETEQITRKAVNKGGSHKTSLMRGSTMKGEAYLEMTTHKMACMPPNETVAATGESWNPLTHTCNLEATSKAGHPVYELHSVRVSSTSLPCNPVAYSCNRVAYICNRMAYSCNHAATVFAGERQVSAGPHHRELEGRHDPARIHRVDLVLCCASPPEPAPVCRFRRAGEALEAEAWGD